MKKRGGIKIAMKVSGGELEQKKRLALDLLGAKEVYTEPGLYVLQLPDGSVMELYGPGSNHPAFLFEQSNTVLCFRVTNLEATLATLKLAGAEPVSDIQPLGTCFSYCYIRDNKGQIFGLTNE